jgi:hypothetical protein
LPDNKKGHQPVYFTPLMALKLAGSGLHAGPVTMTRVIMTTGMVWGLVERSARPVNTVRIKDPKFECSLQVWQMQVGLGMSFVNGRIMC